MGGHSGGPVLQDRVRKTTDMVICPVVGGRLHSIAVPAPKIIFCDDSMDIQ